MLSEGRIRGMLLGQDISVAVAGKRVTQNTDVEAQPTDAANPSPDQLRGKKIKRDLLTKNIFNGNYL